jgi:hypothetical protein
MSTLLSWMQQFVTTAAAVAVVAFLGGRWVESGLKSHFDRGLEDYKLELRAHEQGVKIAEYASYVRSLKPEADNEEFRRANQLSWELFLWLPEDAYRKLGKGLQGDAKSLADALVNVRGVLLKDRAGGLGGDDLIFHGRRPDAGKADP